MKIHQFVNLLDQLDKKPAPGKRVLVWIGTKESLYAHLQTKKFNVLAIADLQIDDKDLGNDERIKKALKRAIDLQLRSFQIEESTLQILVVPDAELIARYDLTLQSFYDYFIGDSKIVILVVEYAPIDIDTNLAGYFKSDENCVLRYLKNILDSSYDAYKKAPIIVNEDEGERIWLNLS